MRAASRKSNRGIALILNAAMLFFTIAFVGLAVDVGTLYVVKGKLGAAVDAAALAAGRGVNISSSLSQAQSQATGLAGQFLQANFPTGYMGSLAAPTVSSSFTQARDGSGNPTGILDVAVTASVASPTYFMRIFGINSITVAASGKASRKALNLIIVLDRSSSMNTSPAPSACQAMVSAAQTFITLFSPYDQIGLITFDYTAHLLYPPSSSFGDGTLAGIINGITCNNNTNTTAALELAYQQLRTINMPLAENAIVLFTDGSPNGLNANFPLRTLADNRYGTDGTVHTPLPVICTTAGTVTGAIAQESGQDPNGGATGGVFPPTDADSVYLPTAPCGSTGSGTRQMIAYIPDTDLYGNSTHGVTATGPGPTVSNSGPSSGLVSRDTWIFQENQHCIPGTSTCKFLGDFWSNYPTVGTGSNFFLSGAYAGKLRPDQPNTIVAASMNSAIAEAYKIRSDTTINPIIHTIYLVGNGGDAIDREFLPIIANTPTILPLPFDDASYIPYTNPAFQIHQQQGKYLVTSDRTQLTALFQALASSVLRLSQ